VCVCEHLCIVRVMKEKKAKLKKMKHSLKYRRMKNYWSGSACLNNASDIAA